MKHLILLASGAALAAAAPPPPAKAPVRSPGDAVKASAESAIRAAIANATLDDILGAGKIEIQTRVRESMQSVLDDYQSGIRIVSVALNNASAPQQVMDAFKDVTAAQNDRQSNITQARGYAIQIIANAQSHERGGSVVLRFLLRYVLVGIVAYAIFKSSSQAFWGFLFALGLPVAAILGEAAYEAYGALRYG